MNQSAAVGYTAIVPRKREPLLPNAIFGMLLFVVTEVMFFAALISAFLVVRAGAQNGEWVIPEDVTLPIATTGFNTLVLLSSGVFMFLAGRQWARKQETSKVEGSFLLAIVLGAFFVGFQGYEWVNLIKWGMTLQSNIFTSCFYLIIGSHAIHALAAILVMAYWFLKFRAGKMNLTQMRALQIFWFFVVGVWPVLYGLVYF